MRGLIYGITVRLAKKFSEATIEKILVNEPVTIMSVVPFMLQKLLEQRKNSQCHYNKYFRCMLLGGGTTDMGSSPKCWCKLNSANLSFHKLKHTGFF